jgi:hypothetical protein
MAERRASFSDQVSFTLYGNTTRTLGAPEVTLILLSTGIGIKNSNSGVAPYEYLKLLNTPIAYEYNTRFYFLSLAFSAMINAFISHDCLQATFLPIINIALYRLYMRMYTTSNTKVK